MSDKTIDCSNDSTVHPDGLRASRRGFLKTSGLGIAGLALSSHGALAAKSAPRLATPVGRGKKVERIRIFNRPDYLRIQGTAYEAGRAYGEAMAPMIHYSWRECQRKVYERSQQPVPDLLERVKKLADWTQKRWPLEIEEIAGIADGSGLDFEQVFLINRQLATFFCSNIAVARSADGPIAGGNLDDPRVYFIKDTSIKGQYRYVSLTWPGCMGCHNGMNEHGLSMMGSAACAKYVKLKELPDPVTDVANLFARTLRSCRNVKEAIEFMDTPGVVGSGNYVLVDPSGEAVIVEKAGATIISVRRPDESGCVCSVNYFVSEFDTEERMKTVDKMNIDRIPAMARARAKMNDQNGLSVVKSFLCDTELAGGNYPVSSWHTTISFIAIPSRMEFLASDGPPHLAGYHSFRLR
ncbi:MAG: twin-arginine translocation signal domain-containing protein [Armatimonadetes bacterium]|nr:twin-arginine translocation signal domain-containing protein [Armatimonadota bacterium]